MVGVAVPLTLGIGAAGAWGFCALCRCHRDRLQRKERESPNLMMSYRMWVVAFSSFGIGYTWAMQFCRGTGLFKALGLSDNQLMFVFLPGSLIGLFVQPILGIFSDNHRSRYGRRRPFIFAGAILLAVAYGLLANAYSIGNAFGDSEAVSRPSDIRPVGAGVAIVSFWVADFAINAAQLPCRVLATDIVEESLQEAVMARFSITDNAGKVVAYLLGSISLANSDWGAPGDTDFIVDVRLQFTIAVSWILLSFMTVCCFITEEDTSAGVTTAAEGYDDGEDGYYDAHDHDYNNMNDDSAFLESGGAQKKRGKKRAAKNGSSRSSSSSRSRSGAGGGGGGGSCSEIGKSLGVIRDKVGATFTATGVDPLVPLKHCCLVEMNAWVAWAVLGLWGPIYLGIEIYGGDPNAITCGLPLLVDANGDTHIDGASPSPSFTGVHNTTDHSSLSSSRGLMLGGPFAVWRGLAGLLVNPSTPWVGDDDYTLGLMLNQTANTVAEEAEAAAEAAADLGASEGEQIEAAFASTGTEEAVYLAAPVPAFPYDPAFDPGRCEPDLDRREAFENGLHVFALSFGVSCLVSLLLSPCLPAAIRCMGNRQIWGWSQLLLSAATFALALLPSLEGEAWEPTGNGMLDHPKGRAVAALITFTGISWSVKMTVPYAIVGRNYPGEAIATAVLNCALCLSQLCVALTTPFLIAIAGGKVSAAFWPAGVATLVAAAVAFTMQDTAGQLQGPATTTTTTTTKKPQKYRPVSSTER